MSHIPESLDRECLDVAKLASRVTEQIAYAIGVAEPVSVLVDSHGSVADEQLEAAVRAVFDLTPCGIIDSLQLRRPIYRQTAAYGHFGRGEFSWAQTDAAARLLAALSSAGVLVA